MSRSCCGACCQGSVAAATELLAGQKIMFLTGNGQPESDAKQHRSHFFRAPVSVAHQF